MAVPPTPTPQEQLPDIHVVRPLPQILLLGALLGALLSALPGTRLAPLLGTLLGINVAPNPLWRH